MRALSLFKLIDTLSSTGANLYAVVKENLENSNINIKYLVSKFYNGGANMAGIYSRLHAHFKMIPQFYFYPLSCASLNLPIEDISSCHDRQNLFVYCEKNRVFFSHVHLREQIYEKIYKTTKKATKSS